MKGTSVDSTVPIYPGTISTKETRASCAVPIGHGPSSARGTHAHNAVLLSRRKHLATGVRVSNAAPLNHGTGACASRAAPPSHASRSNEAAATARRPPKRTCSLSPLSDQLVAVGLRCGKGKTETPRSLARFDPVFPRYSIGLSIFFPIKEESSRLATSFPFSKRANGKESPRVGLC